MTKADRRQVQMIRRYLAGLKTPTLRVRQRSAGWPRLHTTVSKVEHIRQAMRWEDGQRRKDWAERLARIERMSA